MIRIELVEDGLPTAVLYDYVDAIEEAMLREQEVFEWALARHLQSICRRSCTAVAFVIRWWRRRCCAATTAPSVAAPSTTTFFR